MVARPIQTELVIKPVTTALSDMVPDNFFKALVEGRSLGILICAILFGLAFAALRRRG